MRLLLAPINFDNKKGLVMNAIEKIRCPNCGSQAERHFTSQDLVRTQCQFCDYLMVTRRATSTVIEAYAPGISCEHMIFSLQLNRLRCLTVH